MLDSILLGVSFIIIGAFISSNEIAWRIFVVACLMLIVFAISANASIPTPPSFLQKTPVDKLYKKVRKGGFLGTRLGATTTVEEIPVLERHPKLKGVHPDLVRIMDVASHHVSLTVFEGCRTLAKQKEYFKKGVTKTLNSKHLECKAMDVFFKRSDGISIWNKDQAAITCGYLKGIADSLGIKVRMGCAWSGSIRHRPSEFRDFFHTELQEKK